MQREYAYIIQECCNQNPAMEVSPQKVKKEIWFNLHSLHTKILKRFDSLRNIRTIKKETEDVIGFINKFINISKNSTSTSSFNATSTRQGLCMTQRTVAYNH